ncbi:hypothetical protein [Anaerotignum sp. MB30-C6]|uniref:hypothetical protein n=1 Tax=Anaerotignum sp. MB30-C6 TaxID=3070814 RepID=UPI0027DDD55D|nr:hypothetical protein [Anaerotignum sp. MB30-C6]WMI81261.1 hypothetical protein RBQ60_00590 [Anaerotignum sp. MB30-C6]
MILFWILIIFSAYLLDKYFIHPLFEKQKPACFIDWLKADIQNGCRQWRELKENIRKAFGKNK